jgi:hypothetical protein
LIIENYIDKIVSLTIKLFNLLLTCLVQKKPKRTPNETISERNGKGTEFAPLNANEHEPNANEFYREVPLIRRTFSGSVEF